MRLWHKIAALLVLAATVPLAVVGLLLVRVNEQALAREVCGRFDQTARHAAESIAADVDERAHLVARLARAMRWRAMSPEETRGALELIARQVDGSAASLSGPKGEELARFPDRARGPRPHTPSPAEGAVHLGALREEEDRAVHATATLALTDEAGAPLVLAVDLSLGRLRDRLDAVRGGAPLRIALLDGEADVVAASPPLPFASRLGGPVVADDLHAGGDGAARYFPASGGAGVIGARAAVGTLGWWIIVDEPSAIALEPAQALRRVTLAGGGGAIIAALLLSLLFAGQLTRALGRLGDAARALAAGQLDHRVRPTGGDELAALGNSFDRMADQLATSRGEIEAWSRELERRVEQRTDELRQAQAQLVEAQKLAALGQLGAGVAHEINNPLGGVIGHVQLLLAREGHPDREALRCIEEGARRASQVAQNLLRFSVQRKAPVYTSVDLNRIARETASLTESLIRDGGVELELLLDEASPRVWGDAGQLAQVVLNLLTNARTATPRGGRIRLRTVARDGGAAISVADSGKGIAAEHRARIFEPFFTTKDEWSNVGLGLSVSFRIVNEHRGTIDVESGPGRGATFTVSLPSRPAEAAAS